MRVMWLHVNNIYDLVGHMLACLRMYIYGHHEFYFRNDFKLNLMLSHDISEGGPQKYISSSVCAGECVSVKA